MRCPTIIVISLITTWTSAIPIGPDSAGPSEAGPSAKLEDDRTLALIELEYQACVAEKDAWVANVVNWGNMGQERFEAWIGQEKARCQKLKDEHTRAVADRARKRALIENMDRETALRFAIDEFKKCIDATKGVDTIDRVLLEIKRAAICHEERVWLRWAIVDRHGGQQARRKDASSSTDPFLKFSLADAQKAVGRSFSQAKQVATDWERSGMFPASVRAGLAGIMKGASKGAGAPVKVMPI